ncbi:NAD(P)-binding domain-containing protein [Verrucosispora sp. WMMD573]|uniref:NADPH-dependent F420 reductase n=1 Tax=Verrucosispora sp. WMMD573 TaxID=3015149 RepID=UPI00248B22F7|nr:NAD(P)-binding domain-containing protein [Verrucosispora sp. WMMD573]WBB53817.1 NAD(P)-binding domain-containing protein [Verrucosispora sp. WMMD573]
MIPVQAERPTVGVIGFGKVGTVLARLARNAGHRVLAAGSGDPEAIVLTAEILTPGVETGWAHEVAEIADIVILAIPLRSHRQLPAAQLAGKVVIDAVNHWLETDGPRADWLDAQESSSEHLRDALPGARLVKGFNHLGYHDIDERPKPRGAADRIAIALASDDADALSRVAALVDDLGFDPVILGTLPLGRMLEPGGPIFGDVLTAEALKARVRPR